MQTQSVKTGLADYLHKHIHQEGIIVCDHPKFIYMKPAKTAGTSILRHAFAKTDLDIFHQKDHPERFNSWLAQMDDLALSDYLIFSFVRNPWDRLVSVASYFGIRFDMFVRNYQEYMDDPRLYMHSLPQNLYTHFEDGSIFADYIGRFENLQHDFNKICDRLQLARLQLPHKNRSIHAHYSMYYDDDILGLVNNIYEKDILYYSYQFEVKYSLGGKLVRFLGRSLNLRILLKRVARQTLNKLTSR